MQVVSLVKFRGRPTEEDLDAFAGHVQEWSSKGVKVQQSFYTLGRYEAVLVLEGPDERSIMQFMMGMPEVTDTETMIAVPRDVAIKWLG